MTKHSLRRNLTGWLFALPAILGFVLLSLLPMAASFVLSLTNYRVANTPTFIGLENYTNLFTGVDPFFFKSLLVTVYYVALSVPAQLAFAFVVALLMNRPIRGRAVFRVIFYLPSVIPSVASSMIWLWLLDPNMGLVNMTLKALGLPTSQWIFAESTVVPSLVLMSLWTTGSTMLIFLAGLQGIPRNLYEAVQIDGGGVWSCFWSVTVPMMSPTIFFNLVIGIIAGFQTFTQPFVMTQGGPNNASLFYAFYLYREAFRFQNIGASCAIVWVLFAIIAILSLIIFRSSDRWVYYEGGNNG